MYLTFSPSFQDGPFIGAKNEDVLKKESDLQPPLPEISPKNNSSFNQYMEQENWDKAFLDVPYFFSSSFSSLAFLHRLQGLKEAKLAHIFSHPHFPWYVFNQNQLLELLEQQESPVLKQAFCHRQFPWHLLEEQSILVLLDFLSAQDKMQVASFIPWKGFSNFGKIRFQTGFSQHDLPKLMLQNGYPWRELDIRFLSLKIRELKPIDQGKVLATATFPWDLFSSSFLLKLLISLDSGILHSVLNTDSFPYSQFEDKQLKELLIRLDKSEQYQLFKQLPSVMQTLSASSLEFFMDQFPQQDKLLLSLESHFPWKKLDRKWVVAFISSFNGQDLRHFFQCPQVPWYLFTKQELGKLGEKFWFWDRSAIKELQNNLSV